jgi:hypothetical protein
MSWNGDKADVSVVGDEEGVPYCMRFVFVLRQFGFHDDRIVDRVCVVRLDVHAKSGGNVEIGSEGGRTELLGVIEVSWRE